MRLLVLCGAAAVLLTACGDSPTPPRTIELTVEGTPVTLVHCGTRTRWVGYQVEGGSWRQAIPRDSGSVTFGVGPRGALAWTTELATYQHFANFRTTIVYGTASELTEIARGFAEHWCPPAPRSAMATGQLTGLQEGDRVSVYLPDTSAYVESHTLGQFAVPVRPTPAADLVAVRRNILSSTPYGLPIKDVLVSRGHGLQESATVPAMDFAQGGPVALEPRTIVHGAPSSVSGIGVFLRTANGTVAPLDGPLTSGISIPFGQYPVASMVPGDLHEVRVFGGDYRSGREEWRIIWLRDLEGLAVDVGPALPCLEVGVLSQAAPQRYRAHLAAQDAYDRYARVEFDDGFDNFVEVIRTAGSRNGATTWDLTIPDFGTNTGYIPGFGLLATPRFTWSAGTALLPGELAPAEGKRVDRASQTLISPEPECPAI